MTSTFQPVDSGARVLTTRFFKVSPAEKRRESNCGTVRSHSTSAAIVGVPGVSTSCAAGWDPAVACGRAISAASMLAAYSHDEHSTKVSSPAGVGARNSSEAEPPMDPDTAETIR